jgi:hypothetical protein
MRLQDVLKEREQEIAHLEISLKKESSHTHAIELAGSDWSSCRRQHRQSLGIFVSKNN